MVRAEEDEEGLPRFEPPPARDVVRPLRAMATLVSAAVIIAGLYFGSVVLVPVALAALLSLMLAPAVRVLRRYVGRVGAVVIAVLFAAIVIFGLAYAIGEEVLTLARNLPQYQDNIATKIRSFNHVPGGGVIGRATQVFRDLGNEFAGPSPLASGSPGAAGQPAQPVPVEIHSPQQTPLLMLRDILGPLLPPLATGGLVGLFIVMILLKREDLRGRLLRLAGAGDMHRTTAAMNEAAERVSSYLLMQLAVGLIYGVPVGVGLALIGIPNAPLWGIVGVIMRFMPYLGGPLTAVFPVILAFAVDPGWSLLLWTILLFVGIEVVVGNLVEPWLYSRTTGLSSVAVIAAASFWTWLWGPVGLLLATPLTVCLVVLGRYVPPLQFLDILLGNEPVLAPQESFYQRLLARDPEEATEQAEAFVRDSSMDAFCDEVAMPALALAQADSDRGALSGERCALIAAGFATILDNLVVDGLAEAEDEERPGRKLPEPVVCIAGRNELDLAAAWLLQHLLRRRGHRTAVFSPDAVSAFNIDRLPLDGAAVVCLSLVSSGSPARARYLIRRIRRRARRARLMIGLWGEPMTPATIAELTTATAADVVVTSLREALADVEALLAGAAQPALIDKSARQSA